MKTPALTCVEVAVAVPVSGSFTYAVPPELRDRAHVGCRVMVPFHNRRVVGFVLEEAPPPGQKELKRVLEILDEIPLFPPGMVPFFRWLSKYYLHPLGMVISAALPPGLGPMTRKSAVLTEEGKRALQLLPADAEEHLRLLWVKEHPGRRLPWPPERLRRLEKAGWVELHDHVSAPASDPPKRRFIRARSHEELQRFLTRHKDTLKAENETAFLRRFTTPHPVLGSEITKNFKNGRYLIDKWIQRGMLEAVWAPVFRDLAGQVISPSPPPQALFPQQNEACRRIQTLMERERFGVCLLDGVTGSGKTEVYFRAVEQVLRAGRQAIVLVPEISLAVYMEGLFRSRLGEQVGVFHSALSRGERYWQWYRMGRGEIGVVIGARSALFAPLPKLGLIIVDEEHDPAYKQETGLRYQARDAAVMRARIEGIVAILGSGTPSVQSTYNALSGKYHRVSMPERIEKRPLPDVDIVDLKEADRAAEMLTPRLLDALRRNLQAGHQAMLFLNRRGFHRLFLCRDCGQPLRCPNCEVSLTYHRSTARLTCHYCGFHTKIQQRCPQCGGANLRSYGFGTEKLEEELAAHFPEARVARMDADSTRRKGEVFRILKRFGEQDLDILLGTQMITKGYDFPRVTLVGVIAADLSLAFPDFRAAERTFQLLSQVAGRAGRGEQPGRVLVQTFNPDHYAVQATVAHDYAALYKQEKALRELLGYPPFAYLACLRLQGNVSEKTSQRAQELAAAMHAFLARWPKRGREIQILGPVEAPIPKLLGKYRWHILVKAKKANLLQRYLMEVDRLQKKVLAATGVTLVLDVDPYQMI